MDEKAKCPIALLEQISSFIEKELGLYFPPERSCDLERGMAACAADFGFADAEACVRWLLSTEPTKEQLEKMAVHLTVGETFFFRDRELFAALEEQFFPELIKRKREKDKTIRIWSAGCSSGEEPYSLAILLDRLLPDIADWKIMVLASDINPAALAKAEGARYNEWSFRDTPSWVKKDYFDKVKHEFTLQEKIKRLVSFFALNLAQTDYAGVDSRIAELDLIFCRNVLMYFSRERSLKVVKKLYGCTAQYGWIVMNPLEATPEVRALFTLPSPFTSAMHGRGAFEMPQPLCASGDVLVLPKNVFSPPEEAEGDSAGKNAPEFETTSVIDAAQGQNLADQGRLSEALEWCKAALERDKLNPALHHLSAMIFLEMERKEEASIALKRVIYLKPDSVLAHFSLGCLYHQQEQSAEAEKHFTAVRMLLAGHEPEEMVSDTDGISVAGLLEIMQGIAQGENGVKT
ncbi:CheR family methyltransferase [Azotosporobacter soli]|uniref:CheR family methyltransferase n=1 Tax=Azotosporobacter soli TaxID=3055040 RepID=UPI0031FEA0A8